MKLMSARDSARPAPLSTENRAPAIRAARSKSRMPSAAPRSQCGFGSKSNVLAARRGAALPGCPRRSCRPAPTRVRQVGQRQQQRLAADARASRRFTPSCLICCAAGTVGLLNGGRIEASAASALRDLVARRCSAARFEAFDARESAGAARSRAWRSLRARLSAIEPAVSGDRCGPRSMLSRTYAGSSMLPRECGYSTNTPAPPRAARAVRVHRVAVCPGMRAADRGTRGIL